jgi:CubicO group peptidase (beta-lactamase class C family)
MRGLAVVLLLAAVAQPLRAQERPGPALGPELAEVAAAYAAKVAASALFVSGRTLDSVRAEELAPTRPLEALIAPLLRFDVDDAAGTVTCRLGQAKATAVRTQGLGCTLAIAPATVAQLQARKGPAADAGGADAPWPLGESVPELAVAGIDHAALAKAIDAAFADPDAKRRVHTRAVVVVHDGRLVAERYADGYRADMPLPGWSMAKTMAYALLGARELQEPGRLPLAADVASLAREWTGDARAQIRFPHLLTMTAGLQWNESYDDPASDALRMLFRSADHAATWAAQPPAAAPGREYVYSSGTTNFLCRLLRSTFATDAEHLAFPRTHLFAPLAMRSAVLETDPSGTFVGSSYAFATARDWARLGMLLAQRGEFAGRRVVAAEWIDAAFIAAPASNGRFGKHLWLDADPDGDGPRTRRWPELPGDLGYMSGHEGQYCAIVPSAKLVVVRLGCTKNGGFDLRALLRAVLGAIRG